MLSYVELKLVMLVMEICVLSVTGIVSVNYLFFRGGSGSRIFLLAVVIWPVLEMSEMNVGCNVLLQDII
jgi:hypothetical protein